MKIKLFFKEHPLLFTVLYMIFYLVSFTLLEEFVKPKFIIHCALDDVIPFCEYFIIPYLLWFFYVSFSVLYLMHHDRESFWRLAVMMFGGMTVCIIIYIIFPNGLMLRSYVPDRNIFCRIVNAVYLVDTSTNVCPSIHVLNSLSVHSALSHSHMMKNYRVVKLLSAVFASLVCVSTVMLDQHSIVDVLCAVLLFLVMERIAYRQKDAELKPVKT